jgi:hypothetical protein
MQVKLGVFYQHGRGVAKDAFMATEWYAQCALRPLVCASRALVCALRALVRMPSWRHSGMRRRRRSSVP